MKQHTPTLSTSLALVSETGAKSLPDPREHLAALVALGFDRCPAPFVAQRLGRGTSTVYGWAQPGLVGGLRALDLLSAPTPFARVVVRGLAVAVAGAPPPDGPSRGSLAALLARIASTLILAAQEDPERLPPEVVQERIRLFDEQEEALRRARAPYDAAALRHQLAQARRLPATEGEG